MSSLQSVTYDLVFTDAERRMVSIVPVSSL